MFNENNSETLRRARPSKAATEQHIHSSRIGRISHGRRGFWQTYAVVEMTNVVSAYFWSNFFSYGINSPFFVRM